MQNIVTVISKLFSTMGLMPHGHCYLWKPGLVWLHVISDSLIGFAYVSISITLYALVKKIKIQFSAILLSFGLFIGACGATHFMEVYTLWEPQYWWAGLVKLVTALASISTCIWLVQLRHPIILVAETAKLSEERHLNLKILTSTLERKVQERTAELEKSQSELRENQERLSLALQASEIGIWDLDLTTRAITWTETQEKMFGYGKGEFSSKEEDFWNRVHPDDLERVNEALTKSIESHQDYDIEYRIVWPNKVIHWVHAKGRPYYDSNGLSVRMTGTVANITNKKRDEDSLRFLAYVSSSLSSNLDYKGAFQKLAQLVIPTLGDWCVIHLLQENGMLEQKAIAHLDPEKEKIAKRFEGKRMELSSVEKSGISDVLRTKKSIVYPDLEDPIWLARELSVEHPEILRELGARSYMIVPLIVRDQIFGTVIFILSNTFRRYNKYDLDLAEDFVRRAATAVDNARLYQEAQYAIQARDDILAVVSHDLRNPLGSILMTVSFMQKKFLHDEEGKLILQQMEKIKRAGERMNALIEDLLSLAKLETGHFSLHIVSTPLSKLVRESIDMLQGFASEKRIKIELQLENEGIQIHCDPNQISRVFSNLIGNAIKFSPEESSIVIKESTLDECIEFSITDSGPGIASQDIPHIFDRFWQARKTAHKGTGLGLAIVKGIIEAHGGKVRVESTFGHGATFCFSLPKQTNKSLNGQKDNPS